MITNSKYGDPTIPEFRADTLKASPAYGAGRVSRNSAYGMPDTRNAFWRMARYMPIVVIDRVHLRDAVQLLQFLSADRNCPVEIWSDDRGLNFTWGNALARLPATDWLIGRFEAEPDVFFASLPFPTRVRPLPVSVRYCGRDQIVFGRRRVPGIRFVD